MDVDFTRFRSDDPDDAAALATLWASDTWPFHVKRVRGLDEVQELIASGALDGGSDRTYWIVADGDRAGFVHIEDLHADDGDPLFDLRIHTTQRGRGLGSATVRWLTAAVFGEFPHVTRIEAQTRCDNRAMRHVLESCGYVKEAHYRRAWPASDGSIHDGIGYAILRTDWTSGRTTPVDWNDTP